jgi:ubiquinone/menaquinone biosynthesis C-methylase UbiE
VVNHLDREREDHVITMNAHTQTPVDPTVIQRSWDAIAAGYDEYVTPAHAWLANEALDRVELGAGGRFLDVASGSGALSMAAARRGARVLGTDISPGMIERLNDHARRYGLDNLSGRVMDGHSLDLDDGSFDVSGSMFGVMLFSDLPRGLSEMARVTRPGGKVLVVTFGPPQQVEFLGFFLTAARQVVPDFSGLPLDPPPLPFQVSAPGIMRARMEGAGLLDVSVTTVTEKLEFASAVDLWNWIGNSNPIGAGLIGRFSQDQAASVREVLDHMLGERSGGSGPARLTNAINIGIGTA